MKRICLISGVLLAGALGCQHNDGAGPTPRLTANNPSETWVAIEPTQCLTNPWEQDWLAKHGNDYSGYPKDPTTPGLEPEEFEIIQEYYAEQGVAVSAAETAPKYDSVCLACTCPEGHTMYLSVRDEDVDIMIGFGYRLEAPPGT